MIGNENKSASEVRLEIIRDFSVALPKELQADFELAIDDLENAISQDHRAAISAVLNRRHTSIRIEAAKKRPKGNGDA